MRYLNNTPARLLTAGVLAALVGGCATVKPDEFQAEMSRIRAEMQTGDESLGQRIDEVEASVATLERRMMSLESELQSLASEYDAQVSRLEASLRFAAPVHFDFDDDTVRPQDQELLNRFASVISEHYPGAMVTVEGFTDPSGTAEYNMALGQRRADAVKATLVEDGLDADRVRAVSYGEDTARLVMPGAAGEDDPSAISNRRVVLVVDHATQGMTSMADQMES